MDTEIKYLEDRIKILENENQLLKKILKESNISYEQTACFDSSNIPYNQARVFFHSFWEGQMCMLEDIRIKKQVYLVIFLNVKIFGNMEYVLKQKEKSTMQGL